MDYQAVQDKIIDFLNQKLHNTDAEGFVVGISGGIDSAVTATLAVNAAGKENVTGWITPASTSNKENIDDAVELAEDLGIGYRKTSIDPVVESVVEQSPISVEEVSEGNIRARVRMIYEYLEANENDNIVLGTGNRTELLLGYFTKHGDGAADLMPIADLYKTQVKELAAHLDIDQKFIEKAPTAGLWEGQTDEDELGATYEDMDKILHHLVDKQQSIAETAENLSIDTEEVERFNNMYQRTAHKRKMPELTDLR